MFMKIAILLLYFQPNYILTIDEYCLSLNIYFEARGEPYIGKLAVAEVTTRRVYKKKWGDGYCEVIFSNKQFSWTNNNLFKQYEVDKKAWTEAQKVARMYYELYKQKENTSIVPGACYYHADYVNPYWAKRFIKVRQIDNHVFYKSMEC